MDKLMKSEETEQKKVKKNEIISTELKKKWRNKKKKKQINNFVSESSQLKKNCKETTINLFFQLY